MLAGLVGRPFVGSERLERDAFVGRIERAQLPTPAWEEQCSLVLGSSGAGLVRSS